MPQYLTTDQIKAIKDAVLREVSTGNTWEEIKDRSLADLCSANQGALIDDLYENHPRDREHRTGMASHVRIYDQLLGTHRADEINELILRRRRNPDATEQVQAPAGS
jgi:hypothetical protein